MARALPLRNFHAGNRILKSAALNDIPQNDNPAPSPMNLQDLKHKSPAELLEFAESLQIENASTLRRQDMMFAILKQLAENDTAIHGDGVLEAVSYTHLTLPTIYSV